MLDTVVEHAARICEAGEILASITGSIADTKPVFDAIVRNLMRLFGTRLAHVQLLKIKLFISRRPPSTKLKSLPSNFHARWMKIAAAVAP